jgi:hypothetical protein
MSSRIQTKLRLRLQESTGREYELVVEPSGANKSSAEISTNVERMTKLDLCAVLRFAIDELGEALDNLESTGNAKLKRNGGASSRR